MDNEYSQFLHSSYQLEKKLLNAIKIANELEALKCLKKINKNKRATLAWNSIRSLKNSIICSCTLFIRAGIEGGIHAESAYNLSDVFIMQIENLDTRESIETFEIIMVKTIIDQLNKQKVPRLNEIISKAINYIHDQIFQKISLEMIAEELFVNPSYLSTLFKQETNYSITEYINLKKIEESKYFLNHTELKILEVSNLFGFCNQSYYTALFKRYNGVTPAKYKAENL